MKKRRARMSVLATGLVLVMLPIGCGRSPGHAEHGSTGQGTQADGPPPSAIIQGDGGAIVLPAMARANLGLRLVPVERRIVERTLRLPGVFEYLPSARRDHRAPLPGRVELLVEPLERVQAGQPIFRLDSPAWRQLQASLADAALRIDRLAAALAGYPPMLEAIDAHARSLEHAEAVWTQRLEQLQEVHQAGGGRMDELAQARAALAAVQGELARARGERASLVARQEQDRLEHDAARRELDALLAQAGSIVSRPPDRLAEMVDTDRGPRPAWSTIDRIVVKAEHAGVVEDLGATDGAWVESNASVMTLVRPEMVRFRAQGLQSDLGVLRDGLAASVAAPMPSPNGGASAAARAIEGTISLGLHADPQSRTIEVFLVPDEAPQWARPGVVGEMLVVTDATAQPELAIPLAAVYRDGPHTVIFRQDPHDPDRLWRIEADLGRGRRAVRRRPQRAGRGRQGRARRRLPAHAGHQRIGPAGRPLPPRRHLPRRSALGMLGAIIRFSLRSSALVLLLAAVVVGYAAYRLPRTSVDVFPELNAPTVTIMTEAGGLAADEVEQYVTFPIESAVNGMPNARKVRSASAIGLSIVWVDLQWGADLYDARQLVAERLAGVRSSLPEGVEPVITPITSIAGEIMLVSLSSPDGSVGPMALRSYAEFDLRTRLLAVPGVAQVVAIGGQLPEYQVNVDQDRLRLFGLTIQDVAHAAAQAHSTASGGYLANDGGLEIPLRQQSRVTSVDDIAGTLVRQHQGAAVTIGQVADVRLGPALQRGAASEGGRPAVVLSIQKSPGTNTLALTERLDALFDRIEPTLPQGVVLNRDVVRQAHFIERAVHNVTKVLAEAVVIVVIVLVLFLMNLRATLITLTAIPISLAVGLITMDVLDLGLNVMTLGGLTVAIGVLVDDAIIDVENVARRLAQQRSIPPERRTDAVRVIEAASNEIRPSMVFATIIIVLVFVPLLFLGGLEGRFFRPLALTYMISVMASLLVALTVVPAMCRFLLAAPARTARAGREAWLAGALKRAYEPALRWTLRARRWVVLAAAAATIASLALAATFGSAFLPTFNEGTYTVFLLAPPGTSLAESDRLATQVESQLARIEGVRAVVRRTGRAERDEHAEPVSNSEIEISVHPDADRHAVRRAIDAVLAATPGVTTMVGQPIEHRLSHVLSGTPAAIAINVFGQDLDQLRAVAKQIEAALVDLPGARDVNANREVMVTSLVIRYRHADLATVGLTPAKAAEQVRTAIYGDVVQTINQGVQQLDLVVRLAEDQRASVEHVRRLLLHGRDGAVVRLQDVAEVLPQRTSNLITRENAQRKAVVSLNVASGSNLGDLIEQVRERVDPIVRQAGLTASYGGQFEAQRSAARSITIFGLAVALAMLVLLQASTGSIRAALLVMLNVPLALIGGIAAIFVAQPTGALANALALLGVGGPYVPPVISIASMVGFITLFGIAVRNGILLINHYNHLMRDERVPMSHAIVQGSVERLVPILMTAVSAALGLLPLALAAGKPGSELLAPLAIVTLGGLVTSTALNLFVVPAGYAMAFRCDTPRPHRHDTNTPRPGLGQLAGRLIPRRTRSNRNEPKENRDA
ncbi:MAG: hypothetical protein KatS3mg103_1454 [Phycisphaerales bacterium]|nr:MAG: hypothetical protein KatS3mg103_1454 [Phycisphaerales bacterium]